MVVAVVAAAVVVEVPDLVVVDVVLVAVLEVVVELFLGALDGAFCLPAALFDEVPAAAVPEEVERDCPLDVADTFCSDAGTAGGGPG